MLSSPVSAEFNLDSIYETHEGGFQYNVPRNFLESFVDGQAFDHKVSYTPEERVRIEQDLAAIWSRIEASQPESKQKVLLVSAGAPGAGKTTVFERRVKKLTPETAFGYTDPDAVCLKQMQASYGADIESGMDPKQAYDKWRPASNAIHHYMLAQMVKLGWSVAVGTTSSSPYTAGMYQYFKDKGYTIRVIHVSATDDTRWDSITDRDKEFVQTTEEDVKVKGRLIFERIQDTFFKLADHIEFYGREYGKEAILAATWNQGDAAPTSTEAMVEGQDGLAFIRDLHGEHWPK